MNRSAIVAVLAVAGSALIMAGNIDFEGQRFERGLLIPGLEGRINEVASIAIASTDQRVTIERDAEGGWGVVELEGYPADFERAKELVIGLAEATKLEAKTTRAERHGEIGLAGVDQNSTTISITLAAAGGDGLAEVLMGDIGPGMNIRERFVRLAGEDETFLARTPPAPQVAPERWAARELTRLGATEVQSIEVSDGGGGFYAFSRERPDAVFTVASVPDSESAAALAAQNSNTRRAAGAMTSVTWTGVEPIAEAALGQIGATSRFTLFDGRHIEWNREADTRRVTLSASYAPNSDASEADIADIRAEVEAFNERHGPWVYELAAATIEQLFPSPETLVDGLEQTEEGPVGPVPESGPTDDSAPLSPVESDGG